MNVCLCISYLSLIVCICMCVVMYEWNECLSMYLVFISHCLYLSVCSYVSVRCRQYVTDICAHPVNLSFSFSRVFVAFLHGNVSHRQWHLQILLVWQLSKYRYSIGAVVLFLYVFNPRTDVIFLCHRVVSVPGHVWFFESGHGVDTLLPMLSDCLSLIRNVGCLFEFLHSYVCHDYCTGR